MSRYIYPDLGMLDCMAGHWFIMEKIPSILKLKDTPGLQRNMNQSQTAKLKLYFPAFVPSPRQFNVQILRSLIHPVSWSPESRSIPEISRQ